MGQLLTSEPGRGVRSQLARWVAVVCAALAIACDAPTIPALPGPYDFRLSVYGNDGRARVRTFHWDRGSVVPVFLAEEAGGPGDLRQAFRRAARAWRVAAVFGEVRLREAVDLDEAHAVLRWHDAPGVLSTPADCVGPVTGAASTLGCLNHSRDALRSWPRRDGEVSQVFFRVVIRRTDDQELLDRLVIHEMGHALGILSHSPDPSDIMWAGPDLPPEPSARDRSTLRSLYMTPVDLPVETPSRGG